MLRLIRKLLVRGSITYSIAAIAYHYTRFIQQYVYYSVFCSIKVYPNSKRNSEIYPSQFGQDKVAEAIIRKYGVQKTFLEIGANHPKNNSNSYFLEHSMEFEGISVDPIDRTKSYASMRPKTKFINAFVSDTNVGKEPFVKVLGTNGWEDQMSASKSQFIDDGHDYEYEEVMVDRCSLKDLQSQFPYGIGILLIDVEGFELRILRSIDDYNRPKIIIAENAGKINQQKILQLEMRNKGYDLIGRIWTSDDVYIDRYRE